VREVVIVGASFGGLQCAAELKGDAAFRVTVLDSNDFFEFTPSIHTALGGDRAIGALLKPLDEALVAGVAFVRGTAVALEERTVVAAAPDGRAIRLAFDVCVVAVGCVYPSPVRAPRSGAGGLRGARLRHLEAARCALRAAGTVLVVGGGAVGVEMAAELRAPNRRVTLATNAPELCGDLPAATRARVAGALERLGVRVLFRTKAARVGRAAGDGEGPCAGGAFALAGPGGAATEEAFDAYVCCFGARPATSWLAGSLDLDGGGFIAIDPASRRASRRAVGAKGRPASAVYAVGDAAAKPDAQRLASYAHVEGEYVGRAIRGVADGPYAAPPRFVALSLGASDGCFVYDATALPVPGFAVPKIKAMVEAWFIRLLPLPYALLRLLPGDAGARAWSKPPRRAPAAAARQGGVAPPGAGRN